MVNRGHAFGLNTCRFETSIEFENRSAIDLLSTTGDAGDGVALHDDLASLTIVVADRVAPLLEF